MYSDRLSMASDLPDISCSNVLGDCLIVFSIFKDGFNEFLTFNFRPRSFELSTDELCLFLLLFNFSFSLYCSLLEISVVLQKLIYFDCFFIFFHSFNHWINLLVDVLRDIYDLFSCKIFARLEFFHKALNFELLNRFLQYFICFNLICIC